MTDTNAPIREDELHAYVDGQLDPARRAAVEAWLAGHPDAAAEVATWRAQNAALHAAFDPVLREPVPMRLLARRRTFPPVWLRHAAAAVLYVAVGAGAGWWLHDEMVEKPLPPAVASFAERAAVAHSVYVPEVLHPVEVAASEQQHLVNWLSKRLGTPVKAPNLTTVGFELVGGRLLPDARTPAAQFMYQNPQGARVTLYVRIGDTQNRETAFRWVREGNIEVCFWIDGPVGYALAGELDRKEMYRLAKAVYRQLEN